jgi:hypothetical protein
MDLMWRLRTEKIWGLHCLFFSLPSLSGHFFVGRNERRGGRLASGDAGFMRLWPTSRGTMLEGKDAECRRVREEGGGLLWLSTEA